MRRGSFFWGTLLVVFGALFLLSNLGYIDVDIGNLIWPILLIALGLWALAGGLFGRRSPASERVSIPLEGASRAHLTFRHGAGRLEVGPGAGVSEVVSGSFAGGLDPRTRREGDALQVEMRPASRVFTDFPFGGPLDWSVRLSREVPLSIDLESGADEARMDLRELKVTELRVKTGASSTSITLPEKAGFTRVRVEAGVASLKLHVPEGVAARIRTEGGLSNVKVDTARFPLSAGRYVSRDYDTAENKVEIDAETGVGSLEIS